MAKSAPKRRSTKRKPRARAKPAPHAAQRERALEAVLAALAHDIRTPLTGILALGELLATSDIGERERQWAASIKTTAEHIAALTSLIVDAAKADVTGLTLRSEIFSPRALAEAAGVSLAARAETKTLKHQVSIGALPDRVRGDPLRLRGALENLIDNAVKFTDHGSVTLDVSSKAAGKRVMLTFSVTDSGLGMSAAEIKRLFKPFAQANIHIARRYGGAGLGLAFVKRVARAMGGDLTVTSTPDRGSTFRLTASVERVAADASPGAGKDASGRRGANATKALRILCVEDNPYGRVVLNTILTELGHRADFVGTGEAAVIAVGRAGHDLVLMDITLPGIDGVETTRRIRALPEGQGIPVIGITGRASPADEAAARAAGMTGYITKPISPSALDAAFRKIEKA